MVVSTCWYGQVCRVRVGDLDFCVAADCTVNLHDMSTINIVSRY